MGQLLAKYTITEIVVFIVILGFAIKELVTFFDWAHSRLRKTFDKEDEHEEIKEHLETVVNRLNDIETHFNTMINENRVKYNEMQQSIDLLIASDKDDIKAWITAQHHLFVYGYKCIDDYSLDCIEKRYAHYRDEGGNSFIELLMSEIRALPKVSVLSEQEGVEKNVEDKR